MVASVELRASQGFVLVAGDPGPTANIRASQAWAMAAGIYPAEEVRSDQAFALAALDYGMDIRSSQAFVLVAALGRVNDPRVRLWGFTLDGKEFLVMRLGNKETIVCDVELKEFYVWGSGMSSLWRGYTGRNWLGGRGVAAAYSAANIVVGDDGNGSLYFLDPDGTYDDDAVSGGELPREFERFVTGQVVIPQGYSAWPCWGVQLSGSITDAEDALPVNLHYSDDRGKTFVDAGAVDLPSGLDDARANWTSLGSMFAPGRLFRVVDYGALRRVDTLKMDEDPEAGNG